ncbi:MAG: phospholipase D-like domain-containing protein [Rubrivivax sp.]|nr:phospholipase D-like domain-containing protein [Rubrivivax sp.]
MATDFQVSGSNAQALFTLKIHRGEGRALLAMNWRRGEPPQDFVGFAIQYQEPGKPRWLNLPNRLGFARADGTVDAKRLATWLSPIQMFRWVHFPFNAELPGAFTYRVTPVFMDAKDKLSYGQAQEAALELRRETYPGRLNVSFTRGFISSQAFVDTYGDEGDISTLLPDKAERGLDFVPTHPRAEKAYAWMGFEARSALLETLDLALADPQAQVRVIAYDLNEPAIVQRLERLGPRLRLIIDDDGAHGKPGSAETQAEARLAASAGAPHVKRQHLGGLQHNKTIVVDGPAVKKVVCGSTNLSWRGLYVQSNNAIVLSGQRPVAIFAAAFEAYWASDKPADFAATASATWTPLGLKDIRVQVAFSPHGSANALLAGIGQDIAGTRSSLFYSLAFLSITPGVVKNAITQVTQDKTRFVYGMADQPLGGIVLVTPDGNEAPLSPAALGANVPQPFRREPVGGAGVRMHHKFVVIDFDKPTARVYTGSYNFSGAADLKNGENLLLIRNRRVAVAYMIEALGLFDHYRFRVKQAQATRSRQPLTLKRPPRAPGEEPWWADHYRDGPKMRDRKLFSA